MLLHNAFQHGVTHNNVLVHALELLGTFKVSKQILPMLLIHTGGRIPVNNAEYNTLRNMLVNWSHLIDGHGPNSVPLTVPCNPREQAFTHGAYLAMTGEHGDESADDWEGDLPVYGGTAYITSPPPQPAESVVIPRHKLCDGCHRSPGCWHVEGGFDTDTDDEELFMDDPEFDNQMVQAWATVKTDPDVFNQIAGDLYGA